MFVAANVVIEVAPAEGAPDGIRFESVAVAKAKPDVAPDSKSPFRFVPLTVPR